MKKNRFVLILLYFSFMFVGCFQPVFYNIRKEVKLTPRTVSGFVNSIARYTYNGNEYLVTQNGKSVFYKERDKVRDTDYSAWTVRDNETFRGLSYDYYNTDYNGEHIIKTAVDDEYVYIITAVIKMDKDEGESVINGKKLYCTNSLDGNTWQQIAIPSISVSNSTIFCTNAISKEGRKAYFRNEEKEMGDDGKSKTVTKLYELNGLDAPTLIDLPASAIIGGGSVKSAVWFDGDVCFFGTLASTTNETLANDATTVYYGASDGIHYSSDGINFETAKVSVGTISCMAVTKDYLLFGQGDSSSSTSAGGGIYKVALSPKGVPGNKLEIFTTNADAVFTSSYQLLTLLSVDPSKAELESLIYASPNFKTAGGSISVSYDNLCLWSYHPDRGNWNRE